MSDDRKCTCGAPIDSYGCTSIDCTAKAFMKDNKELMQDLAKHETQARIEEIRAYKLSDIVGSAGSIRKDLQFLLAQLDIAQTELQATRERSERLEAALRFYAEKEHMPGLVNTMAGQYWSEAIEEGKVAREAIGLSESDKPSGLLGEEFGKYPKPSGGDEE